MYQQGNIQLLTWGMFTSSGFWQCLIIITINTWRCRSVKIKIWSHILVRDIHISKKEIRTWKNQITVLKLVYVSAFVCINAVVHERKYCVICWYIENINQTVKKSYQEEKVFLMLFLLNSTSINKRIFGNICLSVKVSVSFLNGCNICYYYNLTPKSNTANYIKRFSNSGTHLSP